MKALAKRTAAEFAGTLFLVAAVIGSGIMAERLMSGAADPKLKSGSTTFSIAGKPAPSSVS